MQPGALNVEVTHPLVSVIIVVRNGCHDILGALNSIRGQTYPQLEVLVVDGISSDGTQDLVRKYARDEPSLPVVLLDNPGRIQSSGWNVGIRAAKGQYLLRLDAVHCRLQANYISLCLAKLLELQRTDPAVGAIGGRRESASSSDEPWSEAIVEAQTSRFGVGNATYRFGARAGFTDTVGVALYDRNVMAQTGMFDESLGRSEDNDFHARMRKQGFKLYFFPEAVATYYPRATLAGIASQMFHNGWWISATIVRKRSIPFGFRHMIPFVFYGLLVLLAAFGVGSVFARIAFFLLGGLYLLAATIAGLNCARSFSFWRLICVFLTMHASYAAGTAVGFFAARDHVPTGQSTAPGANLSRR
jgi:GT2 family glycosyltransferase